MSLRKPFASQFLAYGMYLGGSTYPEIAAKLDIKNRTARRYVSRVKQYIDSGGDMNG